MFVTKVITASQRLVPDVLLLAHGPARLKKNPGGFGLRHLCERQQLHTAIPWDDLITEIDFRLSFAQLDASERRGFDQAALYNQVLRTWLRALHGELRGSANHPGPLIRFLKAALRPILGAATPGDKGMERIIRRARQGHTLA
jgi:hypothetical protein